MEGSGARRTELRELSRVCYFAQVSLATRFRNLAGEDNPSDARSCEHQATEVNASFCRIKRAIEEVRDAHRELSNGVLKQFEEISDMCEVMRRRIEREVRGADPDSPWNDAGKRIIVEAHGLICRIDAAAAAELTS